VVVGRRSALREGLVARIAAAADVTGRAPEAGVREEAWDEAALADEDLVTSQQRLHRLLRLGFTLLTVELVEVH